MKSLMNKYVLILLFMCLAFSLAAEQIISLPEIVRPRRMGTDGKNLYILQNSYKVAIFSLSEKKVIKTFGQKGAGPEEFKFLPLMTVTPDYVFFSTVEKYLVFSSEGKFIKEKRLPAKAALYPLGDKFVVYQVNPDMKQKILVTTLSLCDAALKKIKDFHKRGKPLMMMISGTDSARGRIEIVPKHFSTHIDNGKIYVADAEKGFCIDIFDKDGNRLNTIQRKAETVPVDSRIKDRLLEEYFGNEPGMKKIWGQVKQSNDIVYPDFLPVMKSVLVSDGKIYVLTYELKEGKSKWLVLDEKGNTLSTVFLPVSGLSAVKNDTFYSLVDNEETEEWELHIHTLK